MKGRLLKIVIVLNFICFLAITGLLSNSALAAAPADQIFDGKGGFGTDTMKLDGITYTTNNGGKIEVAGSEALSFNLTSASSAYSGNALANDSNWSANPTFFQISSEDLNNNFKMNTMYLIINDIGSCGYSINIKGFEGGKNGTLVASASGIDMSTSGSYGVGDNSVSLVNEINDSGNGEYGGILTFGSNWSDIDTILITNNAGDTKAVYAVVDSLDFSNVLDVLVSDVTVNEGNGNAIFTISLSKSYGEVVTVDYATANNTATTGDFTSKSGTVTISAGNTSTTVTVPINNDTIDEENESFYLNISNPSVGEITDSQGVCTITDDDAEPTISIGNATVAEGDSGTANLDYTVTLSQASGKTVTVDFATQDGTATTADNDYVAKTATTLTFAPGDTIKTITVLANGDTVLEANETVLVKLTNPTNTSITQDTGTGRINNDDSPSISINDVSIAEDSTSLNFTVILSKPSASNVTINYATAANTATQETDYISNSGTITFAPGTTSETLTIVIKEDSIDEENETFYVYLSGATSGITISDAQGIGTITDDDAAPTISIYDTTVTEGNSGTTNAEFTVSLSAESGKTITVNYATANGTAIIGTDYSSKFGNLVFSPEETSKTINIQVYGNTLDEDDKNFQVNLSGASNATILDASALGTITDDDAAPTISIGNATVVEGDSGTANLVYTVTLSQASGKTVTVDYATQDGTATIADSDYTAKTATTLTFALGETSKTITVSANGDTVQEANETVLLKLSNPTNASITEGQDTGTGTITNDDSPVIKVFGNNVNITNGDATPSSTDYTDFGSTAVAGGTVIREFTITNNGNTTLVLSGTSPYITISGTNALDFSVVTGPAISVNSGDTATFTIKFDPSSYGTKNAKITIASNDNSNHPFIFDIKGEGTTPTPTPTPTPTSTSTSNPTPSIDIFINNKKLTYATYEENVEGGEKKTIMKLDDGKVSLQLNKEKDGSTITIPVNNNSDIVVGQLNGQTVKNMQDKDTTLEITTENIIYTIPAEDINIDNVLKEIGRQVPLKDITVKITVSKSSKETITKVEDSAKINNFQLVVKPVDFEITCTNGSKTVTVSKFNNYVERTVILPDGIDNKKITTCVVFNEDGTFSHVPTTVKLVNGKYYAKINSLTNSTYTLIWNPVTFNDVKKHWSKNYVNSVGSRLIDDGVGNSNFAPNRAITRAEFASMIVKALGLKGTNFQEKFSDVKKSDPYYYYIYTAYEYGIIAGYSNGKFGPQDLITKEQAMTMLAKAMDIAGMDVTVSDTDVSNQLKRFKDSSKILKYVRQKAAICVKNGIFIGDKKGRLNLKDNLTRGESATVIIRLLKKAGLI